MESREEELDEARAAWIDNPITAQERKTYHTARNELLMQLLSHGRMSADAAVRANVAALEQVDHILYGLGGKRLKDLWAR